MECNFGCITKLIFDTHTTRCSLCEMQTNNAAAHQLLQCQHTWKLILREKTRQYDPNLLKFIQEAPTMVAARVMTGLQSTSSSHAMNYLLTEVQKIYMKTQVWGRALEERANPGRKGRHISQKLKNRRFHEHPAQVWQIFWLALLPLCVSFANFLWWTNRV